MSVVDVDKIKPWTQETSYSVLSIPGLPEADYREMMPPEEYTAFCEWRKKNNIDIEIIEDNN
jgi:hypothetical protein